MAWRTQRKPQALVFGPLSAFCGRYSSAAQIRPTEPRKLAYRLAVVPPVMLVLSPQPLPAAARCGAGRPHVRCVRHRGRWLILQLMWLGTPPFLPTPRNPANLYRILPPVPHGIPHFRLRLSIGGLGWAAAGNLPAPVAYSV